MVYRRFQVFDVFALLDALNSLSLAFPMQLSLITGTLETASTKPPRFLGQILPSPSSQIYTFETAPPLDVLIVPGMSLITYISGTEPWGSDKLYSHGHGLLSLRLSRHCVHYIKAGSRGGGWTADGYDEQVRLGEDIRISAKGGMGNACAAARWVVDRNVWSLDLRRSEYRNRNNFFVFLEERVRGLLGG